MTGEEIYNIMKKNRLISAFLTAATVFGMFAAFPATVSAAVNVNKDGEPTIQYISQAFATPQEKLDTMVMKKDQNGYELWVEDYSGEIAVVNKATGQILFSNPYDVAGDSGSDSTKTKLLSQILIKYQDNDTDKDMLSFVEAAQRNQIVVKNIKNGIRVEYTMGREETRKLVPRLIEMNRFNTEILANIDDQWTLDKIRSFYTLKDPEDPTLTERGVKEMQAKFPITNKMAVYVCDPEIKDRELNQCESIIKTYCPTYTYESLDEDHALTEYEGSDRAPALFKLALEYTLDEYGLSVRLPANGIRFDESNYKLKSIVVLPYMGAGSNVNTGYNFIPDGSGALLRFEDLIGKPYNVAGKIYGEDFAYQEISGQHSEVMRFPVYGIVENYTTTISTSEEKLVAEEYVDEETGETVPAEYKTETIKTPYAEDKGFLAIITEGDALAQLTSEHGGPLHRYNTVFPTFYPRPSDTYNLADSISIASDASWTVESARKYVDSYRIRYIMLSDENLAKENNVTDYYEASYVGMAKAYRDYLERTGVLSRMTDDEVQDGIPLYIQSLGSMEIQTTILSIPIWVDTAFTTFEDIKTMHQELVDAGVSNVNFRLYAFANGGMAYTMPYNLKWQKVVGGNKGFEDLVEYAKSNNMGLYPDFDFANRMVQRTFDGFNLKKHAIKTINDQYNAKRYYDSASQSFYSMNGSNYGGLCVSPSVFEYFYSKFSTNYQKYNPVGISVSTLGTDLNSDFDKKDPYNREDSKAFTQDLLASIKNDTPSVMIDGGNAFALQYADHILNAALDSSRYNNASNAVPFLGMVLHGYVNIAGTPINMEGDPDYAMLKAIENGAGLYYILSYRNTSELKTYSDTNKFYSVRYDIWLDDVVKQYTTLNDAIKDLQTVRIDDHEFLMGERIPSESEVAADLLAAQAEADAKAEADALKAEKEAKAKALALRLGEEVEEVPEEEEVGEDEALLNEDGTPVEGDAAEGEADAEATDYVYTKYTVDNGSIVRVKYENGTEFLLNYNSFDVTTVYGGKTYTIEALSFIVIK